MKSQAEFPSTCTLTIIHVPPPGILGGRPAIKVEFPGRQEAVESLKALVPPRDRAWDSEAKAWWVPLEYRQALERWAQRFAKPWLVDGDITVNLRTGLRLEQLSLWPRARPAGRDGEIGGKRVAKRIG